MKKIIAGSDQTLKGRFLPAETLWNAAQMVRRKGVVDLQPTGELKPHEILGLAIGIVRRRKKITLNELANKTGFSIEELLAFEAGLLPGRELIKYLPAILREVKISRKSIKPLLQKITAA